MACLGQEPLIVINRTNNLGIPDLCSTPMGKMAPALGSTPNLGRWAVWERGEGHLP